MVPALATAFECLLDLSSISSGGSSEGADGLVTPRTRAPNFLQDRTKKSRKIKRRSSDDHDDSADAGDGTGRADEKKNGEEYEEGGGGNGKGEAKAKRRGGAKGKRDLKRSSTGGVRIGGVGYGGGRALFIGVFIGAVSWMVVATRDYCQVWKTNEQLWLHVVSG
jgi:hypothetical protein